MSSSNFSSSVAILALGSPHGDDQMAWRIADLLSKRPDLQGIVHRLRSPWELLDFAQPDCRLVVLDACRTGNAVGAVLRIPPGSDLAQFGAHSTHGGSIADAIQLAESLGRRIQELTVLGIEVEMCDSGTELSDSAQDVLPSATEAVLRELDALGIIR